MIEIIKWSDCFESADTRKRQRLGWFLSPSGCDSKGFRTLMRMGNDGLIALGFFQALCQSMATMPIETRHSGMFRNSDKTPMELTDILELSRLSGMSLADCQQTLGRLVSVGWISVHNSLDYEQSADRLPLVCQSPPGFVQGEGEGEGQEEGQEPLIFPALEIQKSILPPNYSRLTKTEQGRKKVNHNTPLMVRLGKLFGQKESTLWTIAEYLALQDVNPPADEIELIEQHFSLVIEKNGFRHTALITLLNNWSVARNRAEAYFQEFPDHRTA